VCTDALRTVPTVEAFDELRVVSVLNEIDGKDHTGTLAVGTPVLFGMNFQSINGAKKDSLGGGYADDLSTPNAALIDALTYVDGAIGRMVSRLAANGLTATTGIIITAKHGETSLDPSKRVIQTTSAIQGVLTPAGYGPSSIVKLTEKSTAYIWLKNQNDTLAVANVLTLKANEITLNIAQILSGESLKLLFPDPLTDPAPPDIVIVPNPGTNYEPTLSTALPAVQAEHGGVNENDLHVPLLVVCPSLPPAAFRTPVTTTQIAPSILNLLNLDTNTLQAVRLEGTRVLPGLPLTPGVDNGQSPH
jgi:arylsulfatase A-like enzyme